jgi:LmbE family N-acetylglucosaminyl deacetylase
MTPIRMLGVFAHPDDDVFTLGGVLATSGNRLESTFVFATSGEAGPISDPALATREGLADVRESEQRAAMEALGVAATTTSVFLRHPDYHLPDVDFEHLAGQIESTMRSVSPHTVVTFGPDGVTSHHDHIRAGEAATAAFHAARERAEPGTFERLLYAALPRSAIDRFYESLDEAGSATYGEEGSLFNLTGVPDDEIALWIDVEPARDRKIAAIGAHETQRDEWERIPPSARWIYLDTEAFVQAWPAPVTAEPAADRFLPEDGDDPDHS